MSSSGTWAKVALSNISMTHMLTGSNGSANGGPGDLGGDVLGHGVGLQEGQEGLLDGEVAGVAGGVDVAGAGDLPGGQLGGSGSRGRRRAAPA